MLIKIYIRLLGLWLNFLAIVRPSYAANKGFELFCTPLKIKLSERQKEFMRTAELSTMKTEGLPDIQVYKWGNGSKKILFLHGWQSHTFRWIKYVLALKDKDYTIYGFDAPASGYSKGKILNLPLYGEVLDSFIKKHGPIDYAVGHSLGAFALFYYLHDYNKKAFKKLVSIACPGKATDFVDFYQSLLKLTNRAMGIVSDEFEKRYREISYFDLERFSQGMEVEGLYIHDKGDKDVPFAYTKVLEKNWPQAESMYTTGLGHKVRSEEVVDRVVRFLEE